MTQFTCEPCRVVAGPSPKELRITGNFFLAGSTERRLLCSNSHLRGSVATTQRLGAIRSCCEHPELSDQTLKLLPSGFALLIGSPPGASIFRRTLRRAMLRAQNHQAQWFGPGIKALDQRHGARHQCVATRFIVFTLKPSGHDRSQAAHERGSPITLRLIIQLGCQVSDHQVGATARLQPSNRGIRQFLGYSDIRSRWRRNDQCSN